MSAPGPVPGPAAGFARMSLKGCPPSTVSDSLVSRRPGFPRTGRTCGNPHTELFRVRAAGRAAPPVHSHGFGPSRAPPTRNRTPRSFHALMLEERPVSIGGPTDLAKTIFLAAIFPDNAPLGPPRRRFTNLFLTSFSATRRPKRAGKKFSPANVGSAAGAEGDKSRRWPDVFWVSALNSPSFLVQPLDCLFSRKPIRRSPSASR